LSFDSKAQATAMAVLPKTDSFLEKVSAVRPLFHLIVALTMQYVALSIVTPAIIGVIVEAICPAGQSECSRVIYLSGFQQLVCTRLLPEAHRTTLLSLNHTLDHHNLSRFVKEFEPHVNAEFLSSKSRSHIPQVQEGCVLIPLSSFLDPILTM
jgi:hypothetical protein